MGPLPRMFGSSRAQPQGMGNTWWLHVLGKEGLGMRLMMFHSISCSTLDGEGRGGQAQAQELV
jgi:hypothetical protein